LLTDEVLFPTRSGFHILEAVLKKLQKIDINKKLEEIKPYFVTSKKGTLKEHPFAAYFNDFFIIIHPESGNVTRMLSDEFWLEVVQKFLNLKKYKIIICGTSNKSIELINFLLSNLPNAKGFIINAVQKLSLDELFLLAERAKAAITAESLLAHLCAITCETLSLYKNGSGTFFFPIPNKRVTVIHNHLPSKDVEIHPNISNYYFKNIESKQTAKLVDKFIKHLSN
jgi:ADP-heptose:LPS heptosyltransferase